jgi:hypothetical protein
VRDDHHYHDHDQDIQPDGEVGNPAKLLQCPHLAEHHTQHRPDETADDVADVTVDLVEPLAVTDDDDSHETEQLNGLQDVDDVPSDRPENAKGNISVALEGIAGRVKLQENSPELGLCQLLNSRISRSQTYLPPSVAC